MAALTSSAQGIGNAIFCDEANDTTRLTNILIQATADAPARSPQDYIPLFAKEFLGTPYTAATLERGDDRHVLVCLDGMDCTTMVETVLALAMTAGEGRSSWRDFTYNLERLRYRGGDAQGYASRLHYITDWAIDNEARGILREVTDRLGAPTSYSVKSLDYITAHRDQYPALTDDDEFAVIKHVEEGFHGHRTPYIKPMNIAKAQLRDGDIIAITAKTEGLDVVHLGIVKMDGKKPRLIHASSKAGKTIIDESSLADYVRRRKDATGIRVFRLQ